jgi:hypothetical protein
MITINYQREPYKIESKCALDILEGTAFTGVIGVHVGLFIKAYGCIVMLNKERSSVTDLLNTWSINLKNVYIMEYEEVDLEINVLRKAKDDQNRR